MSTVTDGTLNGLLRAIILSPDEDTPRLMYADYLIERNHFVPAGSGLTDDRVIAERIKLSIEERWEPQRINRATRWWPLWTDMTGMYHRGFYCEVETDADTFLRHADALIWHEGQTVKTVDRCPKCDGSGRTGRVRCVACDGLKTVTTESPRPCPPTAQPIRKVRLTTIPDYGFATTGRATLWGRTTDHWIPRGEPNDHSHSGIAKTLCEMEWPGVEFELSGGTGGLQTVEEMGGHWFPESGNTNTGIDYGGPIAGNTTS